MGQPAQLRSRGIPIWSWCRVSYRNIAMQLVLYEKKCLLVFIKVILRLYK
uniref:Uncharacterized protein n=1 Tax=Anguilla anguilla TaxID=7936 RepID=A0A0E9T0Z1_ANGAN